MAPKSPPPFALYETKFRNNTISRAVEIVILLLLLSLIGYRICNLHSHGYYYTWLLALVCESWFTFNWVLVVSTKWNQVETTTYPQRFLEWVENGSCEFPAVDMFVTTANPELEPPILTVNTVLSLLALEYPANKLACYVSDDSASPVTFYALVEASKFAKLWVPFCKKYDVAVRAPFRYFNGDHTSPPESSREFRREWKKMNDEYANLCGKIENATQNPFLFNKFATFADLDRNDHSTIIKVIWENEESLAVGVPHLIYISREKRPKHQHHFKAGAMNVLTRVSGVITNAPFMLNVDCDFYVNNPKVVLHAMCFLLGAKDERDTGFVQFPQTFYDGLKDDPYASQYKILYHRIGRANAGIQGSFYDGTGCFHRRKAIYGLSPNDTATAEKLTDDDLQKTYGKSKVFITSAVTTLSGSLNSETWYSSVLSHSLEAASQVASCGYEFGTTWGHNIGWRYGSVTEDILTGMGIQRMGWKTGFCVVEPAGFLGCTPSTGLGSLNQMKRWASGHTEILFSMKCPIFAALFGNLQFRQCLAYMFVMLWPVRPIFELCYAFLPPYCLISNSHFLPKGNEVAIVIPASIFIIYNLYTLWEYMEEKESIRAWWNNQRMWRIMSSASWLFGFLTVMFKRLGFSETVFEVTKKDQDHTQDEKSNTGFTFDHSPFFVPGTTILLVNMAALFVGLLRFTQGKAEWGVGEVICSLWIILMFWAFLKGLFGSGKDGIPWSTILKSGALGFLLLHCCNCVY
nr:cellulose synthase-like protein H1 [Ipomoea batatas]